VFVCVGSRTLVRRAFTGTLQGQLATLMDARAVTCATPPSSSARAPLPPPPTHTLAKLSLPVSRDQAATLRPVMPRRGSDGTVIEYCSKACSSGAVPELRAATAQQWAAFEAVAGAVPRADRRCLILAAKLLAHAIAGRAPPRTRSRRGAQLSTETRHTSHGECSSSACSISRHH
jgi:hypothetical protein